MYVTVIMYFSDMGAQKRNGLAWYKTLMRGGAKEVNEGRS